MGMFDTEEWGKLTESLGNRYDNVKNSNSEAERGDLSQGTAAFRNVGEVAGGIGDIVGAGFDFLTPDAITEPIQEAIGTGVQYGMDKTGATEWMQQNPEYAKNIEAGMNILGVIPMARAVPNIAKGAANARGMLNSSPSNFIPNFYGIDNPNVPNTFAEGLFQSAVTKASRTIDSNRDNFIGNSLKSAHNLMSKNKVTKKVGDFGLKQISRFDVDGKQAMAMSRKVVSSAKWAITESAKALATLTVPQARALWKEQGVNQAGQKLIKEHLDNAAVEVAEARMQGKPTSIEQTRSFQKAVAQGIFMRYVGEQAGRKGGVSEGYDRIFEASTFGGIMPVRPDAYLESIKSLQNIAFRKDANGKQIGPERAVNVPDEVNSQAFDHMLAVWKISPEQAKDAFLVVKKPQGSGGDHASSVYHSKFNKSLRDSHARATKAAKKENRKLNDVDLYNELTRLKPDGKTRVYPDVNMRSLSPEDVQAKGLWFTQSGSGRAVVEGGINRLSNFKANGGLTAYISDEHNFLENIPVLGRALNKSLPVREITMTPPISFNVLNKSKGIHKGFGTRNADKGKLDNTVNSGDLETIANARPSPQALNAERAGQNSAYRQGLFTGGVGMALGNEEQPQEVPYSGEVPNNENYQLPMSNVN
jgi:hypothetical protein